MPPVFIVLLLGIPLLALAMRGGSPSSEPGGHEQVCADRFGARLYCGTPQYPSSGCSSLEIYNMTSFRSAVKEHQPVVWSTGQERLQKTLLSMFGDVCPNSWGSQSGLMLDLPILPDSPIEKFGDYVIGDRLRIPLSKAYELSLF